MASSRIPILIILVVMSVLLSACGPSETPDPADPDSAAVDAPVEQLVIRGEMYYLERIALPPDSVALTELRLADAVYGELLAAASEDLGTRQVPIDFELAVDPADLPETGSFEFRAGIRSHPGPLRVTEAVDIELRSGQIDLGSLRLRPVPEVAFGVPYACAEQGVVFGALGDDHFLVINGEVLTLESAVSASGARYQAVDGSETEFWSRGDEAMVTVNGQVLPDCERLRAPSLPLRALGHEPSWLILIDDEAISLNLDFGARQIDFPAVAPEISAGGFRYVTEADDSRLTLVLDRQACNDTMADVAYPLRARFTLDGDARVGCAGAPIDVLTGGEWFIQRIGDAEVVPGTQPTIEFRIEDGEARFSGMASCNRYMGRFQLTGEGLSLSPAASTLMACADEEQAVQERRLTGLLGEVYGFGVDEEGRLVLRTGGGAIVATR